MMVTGDRILESKILDLRETGDELLSPAAYR
jgi:hypothetical protein